MRGARGFTLIEVLAAVGICAAALLAVAGAIDTCAERVMEGRRLLTASRLAAAKLATVLVARRVDEEAGRGSFEGNPDYTWSVQVDEVPFELADLVLDPRTRRVTVVVEWKGGSRRVELVSRRRAELPPAPGETP